MSQKSKQKMPRQRLILIFALLAVTILIVIAITVAWFYHRKGLQTMTKIQFEYLYLKEGVNDTATIPIELGEIDVRNAGEKRIPFRVEASPNANFKLQLGHTTNLPLTYTIIEVTGWNDWKSTQITEENTVKGKYINEVAGTAIADNTQHQETYGTYTNVQKNAEPLYWQSGVLSYGNAEKNYILIVSWKTSNETVIDKDTDMIYLTAGLTKDSAAGTTENATDSGTIDTTGGTK